MSSRNKFLVIGRKMIMAHSFLKSNMRKISLLTCVILVTITLFSHFYLAMEAGHDCGGEEDCPICACMTICEGVLHQVGGAAPLVAAIILFIGFILLDMPIIRTSSVIDSSLVAKKVRLDI
ncbi:MAG: hypothetical protein II915_02985 [Eubacterium sp.]|nr:hypothetical protein [Eubacterium sp.]